MQHVLFIALAAPVSVFAQVCAPPAFEKVELAVQARASVHVGPGNLLDLRVPNGMTRIGLLPGGMSIAYDDGRRITLDLDDGSLARRNNGTDTLPGPLFTSMYQGSSQEGCALLATWRLDRTDYRITLSQGPLTVYAYGSGSEHRFEVIHRDRPEWVVRGAARNMERAAFEQILATISPLEGE